MGRYRETALHHVVATTRVHREGLADADIHMLYETNEDETRPCVEFLAYTFDTGRARQPGWQRQAAQAIGLLIDFGHKGNRGEGKTLERFAEALARGTIKQDGDDPSGLYWEGRSTGQAKKLLSAVMAFAEWLCERRGVGSDGLRRNATFAERLQQWKTVERRRTHSLIGYALDRRAAWRRAAWVPGVSIPGRRTAGTTPEVKAFPEERIGELLERGFERKGAKEGRPQHRNVHLRDILITMLLHGGGLRTSEPFHLYVTDVDVVGEEHDEARVRVFHPEQGEAPNAGSGRTQCVDREEYLWRTWGRRPRTLTPGGQRAGWKDPWLSDTQRKYIEVHWFPSWWGRLFLRLTRTYVNEDRAPEGTHPYLFTSEDSGEPYTIGAYRQAHARAVKRIGLDGGHRQGASPHGHRHAYGRRLERAGVDKLTIQRVMHHKSIQSQEVYTGVEGAEIARILKAAEGRSSNGTRELEWVP